MMTFFICQGEEAAALITQQVLINLIKQVPQLHTIEIMFIHQLHYRHLLQIQPLPVIEFTTLIITIPA